MDDKRRIECPECHGYGIGVQTHHGESRPLCGTCDGEGTVCR